MLPPAVVEQQAKLGVSAEESKAQRLKRQQARFRDRGGAFVPSDSNPLINILLARTVSGESPSKKDTKRRSPSKARPASPTHKPGATTTTEEGQSAARSSKSKPPAPRKWKVKAAEPEADVAQKSGRKRRGRPAKGKKKVSEPGSDTEQPPPPVATSKGNGKRNAVSSALDGKVRPKAKAKSNSAKKVVEVLVSDDDQTLVEVPRKAGSNPKSNIQHEDDGKADDDVTVVRGRATPHVDVSKASGTKAVTRVKTERKTLENGEERTRDEKYLKPNAKKRLAPRDDDVAAPPVKNVKMASSTSAKSNDTAEPDVKSRENSRSTGKMKGKGRAEPKHNSAEPVEEDDARPPEHVTKTRKRKKEEDNYDVRPQKVVKFSEPGPPHLSSRTLKENQSEGKYKSSVDSSLKLVKKPPSRTKMSKGPPREVLERIRASAARYLRCADSEPDELDCLS